MQSTFDAAAANSESPQIFPQPCAPWNIDSMPWKLATTSAPQPGGIMQFAAANTFGQSNNKPQWMQKRKSEQQWSLPPKQLITEERITADFSGLHISGRAADYKQQQQLQQIGTNAGRVVTLIQGGLPSDDLPSTSSGKTDAYSTNPAYQLAAQQLEEKLRNANRIVLCDEVRNLDGVRRQNCGAIPEILLKTLASPCTALIPWQPPPFSAKLLSGDDRQLNASALRTSPMQAQKPVALPELEDYVDLDIDDYLDNNNTCNVNFNKADDDLMDEDL